MCTFPWERSHLRSGSTPPGHARRRHEGADLLDYVANPEVMQVRDGFVERLTGPGLGIEIDEAHVREMAKVGHAWRNPIWRNPDGSITEW